MGIFVIPRSQTLRFVQVFGIPTGNTFTYASQHTFDRHFLMDENWQTPEYKKQITQKFIPKDPILIQLTTNYDITKVKIQLCNYDGSVNVNSNFTQIQLYTYLDLSGNIVWNYLLNQTLVQFNGLYFIKIYYTGTDQPNTVFISEMFEINPKYSFLPYISWQNSDRDGIFWDSAGTTIFGFRAEIRRKYVPNLEASVYEGFNFEPITLYSVSKRGIQLNADPLPRFIVEKLKLAFEHFDVWLNGVYINSNGQTPKITPIDFTNEYDFDHQVIEVDYENYAQLQEMTGEIDTSVFVWVDWDNEILVDYDNLEFQG